MKEAHLTQYLRKRAADERWWEDDGRAEHEEAQWEQVDADKERFKKGLDKAQKGIVDKVTGAMQQHKDQFYSPSQVAANYGGAGVAGGVTGAGIGAGIGYLTGGHEGAGTGAWVGGAAGIPLALLAMAHMRKQYAQTQGWS